MSLSSPHIAALKANLARGGRRTNFKCHLSDDDIKSLRNRYVVPERKSAQTYAPQTQANQAPQMYTAAPYASVQNNPVAYNMQPQYQNYQLVQSYPVQMQYQQPQQYMPVQYQQAQAVNNMTAPMNAANAYNAQIQQPTSQIQGQNLNVNTSSVQAV